MENRSLTEGNSKRVKVRRKPRRKQQPAYNPKTVRLVLRQQLTLNCIGSVTGKRYSFNGAGSSVSVDSRDVTDLLKKSVSGSCCGGANDSPYFEIAE